MQTTEVTRRLAIYSLLLRGTLTSISVMASNVSQGGTWDCATFYQFNGTRSEKHKWHKRYTYFDNFGYHLPFIHPTGEFGLEYEQYTNTMGDTGNAVGANNSFLHDLS